jgi:AraC-like DNA-binding protein
MTRSLPPTPTKASHPTGAESAFPAAGAWLSTLLDSLAFRCEMGSQQELAGHWTLELPGAGIGLIGTGDCVLHIPGQPSLRLSSGDLILWISGPHASLESVAAEPAPSSWEGFADPFGHARILLGSVTSSPRSEDPFRGMLTEPFIARSAAPDGPLAQLVQCLTSLCRCGADRLIIDRLAGVLVVEALRCAVVSRPAASAGWIRAAADPEIGPILEALRAAPEQKWTVAMMAARGAMSRSTFARRFTEVTGMAPMDCLVDIRMQKACDRLSTDRPDLKLIARVTGYRSAAAFSAAFKRWCGLTPSEFRGRK